MKTRHVCFLLMALAAVCAAQPVPPTTAYTRYLLGSTNQAQAQERLGIAGGAPTNSIANTNGTGYGITTLQKVVATNVTSDSFVGNASGLTNVNPANLIPGGTFPPVNSASLTNINPANISPGTAPISITGNAETATYATNLVVNRTNQASSSYAEKYPDYQQLKIGTNTYGGPGGSMQVANYFNIYDRGGNLISFWPSHSGINSSNPPDPVLLLHGGRDVVINGGVDGIVQLGTTGLGSQSYNNYIFAQYCNTNGYSHIFQWRTIYGGDPAYFAIMGFHSPVNGYANGYIYTKSPTFNLNQTPGFSDPGVMTLSFETDAGTNSEVMLHKRFNFLRTTSASATANIDFGTSVQDITPTTTNVIFSFTNQKLGTTNLTPKIVYLRSASQILNITWPSLVNWPTNKLTAGPANMQPLQVLRVRLESAGVGSSNVWADYDYFPDNSFAWDSDALTYFSAITNAGGTISAAQKVAVDTFAKKLKSDSVWTLYEKIAPMVGGTSNSHSVYLKGTGSITWTNEPTHDANGVTFDGSTSFGNTGFDPSAGSIYALNSANLTVVIPTSSATNIGNDNYYTGVIGVNNGRASIYRASATVIQSQGLNNAGAGMALFFADERGVAITTRTASGAQKAYFWQNTAAIGASASGTSTDTQASVASPNSSIYIGARNNNPLAVNHANYTCSGWAVGSGFDDTQALNARDAWAALQNTLGR